MVEDQRITVDQMWVRIPLYFFSNNYIFKEDFIMSNTINTNPTTTESKEETIMANETIKKPGKMQKFKAWLKEHKGEIIHCALTFVGISAYGIWCTNNGYNKGLKQGAWDGMRIGTGFDDWKNVNNLHRGWSTNKDAVLRDPDIKSYLETEHINPNDIMQASMVLNLELTDHGLDQRDDVSPSSDIYNRIRRR